MISEETVNRYLAEAADMKWFGVPLTELSEDELMACAVMGWKAERAVREERARRIDFMKTISPRIGTG